MKTIKIVSILFLTLIAFSSCNDADLNVDNPDGNFSEGGLLDVKSTSINYVVGNPGPYTASIRVFQGAIKTTSIRVAKTFISGTFTSNTVDTFKTIAVTGDQNSMVDYSFTLAELVDGLTGADGAPLSGNDGDYQIGDYWKMDYYVTTSAGEHLNFASTKATISTRYAGTYTVLDSGYFRIGANGGNWNGGSVVIESIDASIYKHNGIGFWSDNAFFFTVDNATGVITIMDVDLDGNGVNLNGQPIMTCEANSLFTVYTPCGGNNVFPDDINGEDQMELTVGYFTSGSGPREFYEKMKKQI
ncbi:MAG: hypothetical protein COC22_05795 [Flavobacteriaceae bacterium]|nr:MAG: hypothetical protein COC22_05795 [Flavobacteriaceae bacterium]